MVLLFDRTRPSQRCDLAAHLLQPVIANAERLEMLERAQDIVLVPAGLADGAANDVCGVIGIERAGILLMLPVDNVGDRLDRTAPSSPAAIQPDIQHAFEINAGHQLAFAQVGKHLVT